MVKQVIHGKLSMKCFLLLKESCYVQGGHRKFVEQFAKIKMDVTKHTGWPSFKAKNLSAIEEEEPNKLFKLMRRIEIEIEDHPTASKSKEEEKKKLEALERAVTKDPTQPPQKKQPINSIDGSISG